GNAVSSETAFDRNAAGVPLLLRGRPASTTGEDGVMTTYDYALGTFDNANRAFTVSSNGPHRRTISMRTTAAAPDGIPGKSVKNLTIQDATHGVTLHSGTLLAADDTPLDWQTHAYDDKNRLRSTRYSDGSSSTNAYSCCRLLWTMDRDGYKVLRSALTGSDHLYHAMEEVSLAELPGHEYYVPYENYQGGHRAGVWVAQGIRGAESPGAGFAPGHRTGIAGRFCREGRHRRQPHHRHDQHHANDLRHHLAPRGCAFLQHTAMIPRFDDEKGTGLRRREDAAKGRGSADRRGRDGFSRRACALGIMWV
ncbi:MAG TPA: hypothetical protein PLF51_18740, partial [Candidatus Hydrogenedentes bacterium]|nr:hypothetical protein [Candidatus Hydrogenedentota bacterium]